MPPALKPGQQPGQPPEGTPTGDIGQDPWGLLGEALQQPDVDSTPTKPLRHTVEPEIPGGPYHMVGHEIPKESERMTPEEAGYMELSGAKKTGDCKIVAVPGGVSFQLGCCNEFEAFDESVQKFSCGTCEYRKSKATGTLVGEEPMEKTKTSREILREKVGALAESKRATVYARMREVAAKEPRQVAAALGELAVSCGVMASQFSAMKDHLDLNEAPRTASLQARVSARKKFAAEFRRRATDNPEQIADAVIQLYHNIDEIAAAIESFAENMGIELPQPGDESEGAEGFENEAPEVPGVPAAPEGLEQQGEELETPEEQAAEEAAGTEGTEADVEQDEELAKEAAGGGGAGFVTDRDEEGNPKPPEKVATGSGGFVTNRDQSAEPKPVEQVKIPVSQGEAAIKLTSLKERAGW